MELIGISLFSLLFGIAIGKLVESARWRKNADDVVRIYSGGHLYKVFYDDPPLGKENNDEKIV